MAWLLNILRFIAPAGVGLIGPVLAQKLVPKLPDSVRDKVTDDKGGFQWWYLLIVFVIAGALVMAALKFLTKGKGKKLFFLLLGLSSAVMFALGQGEPGMILGTALVTLTTGAGVVTSANLNFVPERLYFAAATQLSGVKISVQGDGTIFDSDANGLTAIGVNRIIGVVTNGYVLTLANSLVKNKNTLFEFTNSAAQTPVIYYDSDSTEKLGAQLYLQMAKVPLLIGGNDFVDFATLSLPSLAATDLITINYSDGTVQAGLVRSDLQYVLGFSQATVNTPIYQIDNLNQRIKSVTVLAGAAQTGYVQRWSPAGVRGAIAGQI